ncbi:MAG: hypothetical protein M3041_05695 [Acidobacteriota bacterium]|nr:hypothetical protein [Acidobacteriota bacterium]
MSISPDDATARSHSINLEMLTGNYEAAVRLAKELGKGMETSWAEYVLSLAQMHLGDITAAERTIEAAARKFPAHVLVHSASAILAALKP